MKHQKIRLISRVLAMCFAVLIVCMFIAPLRAFAEEQSYRADQADFDISFNEKGDATITESWKITYTSGNFTRFYKDIFIPPNQLEYFSEINVLSAHINGNDAIKTNSIDRIDYHYYFQKSTSQTYTVHWFKAAHNETVNYDITYEIPNAVKLNKNNDAEYAFRLIGVNFPKTVGLVSTTIHLPSDDALIDSGLSYGELQSDGSTFYSNSSNVSGAFKVRLNMKAEYFSDLIRVASVDVPQELTQNNTQNGTLRPSNTKRHSSGNNPIEWLPLLIISIICVVPLILILGSNIKSAVVTHKEKKYFKANPTLLIDAAERIQETAVPFVWYGFSNVGFPTSSIITFYAEIIDLCHKGYLTVTHDAILFNEVDKKTKPIMCSAKWTKNFSRSWRNIFRSRKLNLPARRSFSQV